MEDGEIEGTNPDEPAASGHQTTEALPSSAALRDRPASKPDERAGRGAVNYSGGSGGIRGGAARDSGFGRGQHRSSHSEGGARGDVWGTPSGVVRWKVPIGRAEDGRLEQRGSIGGSRTAFPPRTNRALYLE